MYLKKILILALYLFFLSSANSQNVVNISGTNNNTTLRSQGGLLSDSMIINAKADSFSKWSVEAAQRYFNSTKSLWFKNNIEWLEIMYKSPKDSIITSLPQIGDTAKTAEQFIALYFRSTAPTAGISGGTILENSSSLSPSTVHWTSTINIGTIPPIHTVITSTNSDNFNEGFSSVSTSGNQSVTIPPTGSITFTNTVTSSDNKYSTASTTYTREDKIYAGFVTTDTPTSSQIISATNSTYVGGKFSTAREQNGALSTPSTSKYIMFANPVYMGIPNITINGLGVSFTISTISFTNSSGYTSNYYVAISPNMTAGEIDNYVVN